MKPVTININPYALPFYGDDDIDAQTFLFSLTGELFGIAMSTLDDQSYRDKLTQHYERISSVVQIPEVHVSEDDYLIHAPADSDDGVDEPLAPMVTICRGDEKIIFYIYSIVAFIEDGKTTLITRMD